MLLINREGDTTVESGQSSKEQESFTDEFSVSRNKTSTSAPFPAVSNVDVFSRGSAGQSFAITPPATDAVSVVSQPVYLNSHVTDAELQPLAAPVTANTSSTDLNTCFASPSATALQTSDGTSRTTYGPMQISAQVLSLPRSVTNCRNLSRPLTVSYAGRQVIVPPSCIVLSAEGAKLLLPPQTIVPNTPLPGPLDLTFNTTSSTDTTNSFLDKTNVPTPVSPSDGKTASETEQCRVSAVPVVKTADFASEACHSTELADQQTFSDAEPKPATDQSIAVAIGNLPDHCLVHVFTFLHLTDLLRVSCVCRQWNIAAHDPSLVNHTAIISLRFSMV